LRIFLETKFLTLSTLPKRFHTKKNVKIAVESNPQSFQDASDEQRCDIPFIQELQRLLGPVLYQKALDDAIELNNRPRIRTEKQNLENLFEGEEDIPDISISQDENSPSIAISQDEDPVERKVNNEATKNRESKYEGPGRVYIMSMPFYDKKKAYDGNRLIYKVGSAKSAKKRGATLSTGNPYLKPIRSWKTPKCRETETCAHKFLDKYNLQNFDHSVTCTEWFLCDYDRIKSAIMESLKIVIGKETEDNEESEESEER
jgi:hypothetical protein